MLKVIIILALVFAGIAILAALASESQRQSSRKPHPVPGAEAWQAEEQRHGHL